MCIKATPIVISLANVGRVCWATDSFSRRKSMGIQACTTQRRHRPGSESGLQASSTLDDTASSAVTVTSPWDLRWIIAPYKHRNWVSHNTFHQHQIHPSLANFLACCKKQDWSQDRTPPTKLSLCWQPIATASGKCWNKQITMIARSAQAWWSQRWSRWPRSSGAVMLTIIAWSALANNWIL